MAAVLLYVCSTFVVWMCCLTTHSLADSLKCPSSCSCLKNHAKCSQTGLVNIPTGIPSWITDVDFQDNGITEIRPDDFKGLDNIEHLNINQNSLKNLNGSVFGDLTSLQTLKLENNNLQEMPVFPHRSGIRELYLSNNAIVSISPLALERMPELRVLDLSGNNILSIINGTFPEGCKLTTLILNTNQIAALEKGSLSNLTELQTLKLNKNKLRELQAKGFTGLTKLRTLELMKNDLSVIKGLTFNGLRELHTLKLKRNDIAVLETAAFFTLERLVNLQLGHNKITAIKADWMFGLKSLKTLSLPRNRISEIDPKSWMCKHLEKLDLSHNQLTSIRTLPLKHLKLLLLNHNSISFIDGAFNELRRLHTLELSHNEISWSVEDMTGMFHSLSRLNRLGLRANGISSIPVHAFSGLQQLKELDLGDNDITSIQENAFETLRKLQSLSFNSSKLSCDCHLSWLPGWLEKNGFSLSATGSCFHPQLLRGMSIFQVDVKGDKECTDDQFLKPVILESPRSSKGFKGENMSLKCVAGVTGNSPPTFKWTRNKERLPESLFEVRATRDRDVNRYTSTLTLRSLHHSSGEAYQCIVSNEFGRAFSQKAYINIYVFPVFTEVPVDVTVKAGKSAELKCAATGQPPPTVSWQKDGGVNFPAARQRRMQVYPDDSHFYILNVQAADQGVYSCKAENEAGTITSNVTVTVLETPDFVKPMQTKVSTRRGEDSVLQCRASGSPQPKLSWLKDGKNLVVTPRHFFTTGNQILVIVDTQWSDAGVYSCRISNSLGTIKGTTKLQVLTPSGEVVEASSSSFGLDDKSTTTGIIIIAVVCCVVGTSLVWVIIIYQTRKRHEMYSAAPSDETTLPGEVPSSGYMSSDKEGSYSQGHLAMTGYHYQDYQMKESGYESSSGQFRVRPTIYANGVDEDEPVHRVTAGDRLLRQKANAHSASSLQYAGTEDDDRDTLGSRHSTSSGQHSGTSEPPSSQSYLSGHSASPVDGHSQLQVQTAESNLHQCQPQHSPRPNFQFSHTDDRAFSNLSSFQIHRAGRGSTSGSRSLLVTPSSPERRPLLQTFHPKKHASSSHERFHANTLDGVGYRGERDGRRGLVPPQRRAVSRDAVAITEGAGDDGDEESFLEERGFRPRTHSDSCDKRPSNQFYPVSLDSEDLQTHCKGCGHRVRGENTSGGECVLENSSNNSGVILPHEIQEGEGSVHYNKNYSHSSGSGNSCSNHSCKGECNGHNTHYNNTSEGSNRAITPSAPPLSSPQSSTTTALSRHHKQQQHHRTPGPHSGRCQQAKGCVHNKTNNNNNTYSSNKHRRKPCISNGPDSLACGCELDDTCSATNERLVSPPCCCEVMRDSDYCTTCSSPPWRGEKEEEDTPWCRRHLNSCNQQQYPHPSSKFPPKGHHHRSGKPGGSGVHRERSSLSVKPGQDPGYSDCEGCTCEQNHQRCTEYSSRPHHVPSGNVDGSLGPPPSYSSLSCSTPPPKPPQSELAPSTSASSASRGHHSGAPFSTIPTVASSCSSNFNGNGNKKSETHQNQHLPS
ncbi:hypothetical protein EGW08_022012 [Elysia chlorotica]|uniref:Ig-like domain-containing protein n=1 Tax=Elysia chlorotica TaxID=188477 RepID=A0A433SM24_ELYCH|nr:hypothetical protein EGW08_022012 [Elysia chlorotica]